MSNGQRECEQGPRDFEERTKLLFEQSVAALDGQTRSKLTQARYRALEELAGKPQAIWSRFWLARGRGCRGRVGELGALAGTDGVGCRW